MTGNTATKETTFKSFGEQALHYFRREHEKIRRTPIPGPAAWRGEDLRRDESWRIDLSDAEVAELERAMAGVRERGLGLGDLGREDFPLPTLAVRAADWAQVLGDGRFRDRAHQRRTRLSHPARSARGALGRRRLGPRLLGPRAPPRHPGRAEPGR